MRRLAERRAQALARHLQQAEAGEPAELDAGTIHLHGIAQHVLHRALVGGRFHVDEVNDDQSADIPQAQLPGDFLGGLQVGVARGRLNVPAARAARGVDVDRHEGLGLVNDEAPAGGQRDLVRIRRFDLALDLVAREQRHRVLVELQLALRIRRHEALHVFHGLLERFWLVDQALAHIVREVVAQAACDRIAFLEYQERGGAAVIGDDDRIPGGLKVIEVPLQLLGRAADSGGAHDGAHAIRDLQPVHGLAHLVPVFALDAARDAAGARIVRHQDEKASGQADEGCQRRTLVAALLLLNLDDQFLAFLEQVLDAGAPLGAAILAEVLIGDFLQRQEPMARRAIFHERSLETRLDARDPAFIDIGFFLFPGRDLNRKVVEFLTIDECNSQFFFLNCVDEHSFHVPQLMW